MRTLVYTCADKEYACWIPLYCLGMLMNNTNIDIEIGIEGTISEDIQECLKMLRLWYPDSQILIKENFFERVGNLALINGKKTTFNAVRFITQPIIKADYVYIGDIDIICMEKNIFQQHIDHMNSLGLVYSNIVRKNDNTHLSGLHFSKYDAYYPIPNFSNINLMINDEIILKKIVELKGHKIDYNTTFRPLHGIHFSKNRPTVKGNDKIPGWGADGWKNEWINFCESEEYKTIYPHLTPFVKKQIKKLNKYYNIDKKINLCIVHHNTPYMTECLVKSINKYTPDCHIYIFDNSDKKPFTYKQDNLTVFDNTKGQIINFDKWLQQFPNKGGEASGKYISAKHCISVDKCMDLINDNFILMDSDILLKQDISNLFDNTYMYIGEVTENEKQIGRLLPFLCFINTNKCKENDIRYFYSDYMHGLNKNSIGQYYDTGAAFLLKTKHYVHKEINLEEYIIHYKGGSWDFIYKTNKEVHGELTSEQWCNLHKRYWADNLNKKVIYTCITGDYETLMEPTVINEDFDYICFTDNIMLKSHIWDIRLIPEELKFLNKVKQQRCIKICPHKYLSEYDTSIWVDGSIDIIGDVNVFLKKECNEDDKIIYIPEHPNRNCIYQEGITCINMKKDTINNIEPQINKYKEEKYPSNNGLVQSNIVIRKHNNKQCIEVMELWKEELIKHSHRDQLSFNYALWKTNNYETFKYLDKTLCNSKYFKWYSRHNRGINNKMDNKINTNLLLNTYNINPKTNNTKEKTIKNEEKTKLSKKEHKEIVRKISNTRKQFKTVKKKINNETLLKAIYENF